MPIRSPQVDAYIARAPEYARPILAKIRHAFHAGCPELEERIKWNSPSFEYKGLLGGMAAFKAHVAFGFWKARLMEDTSGLLRGEPRASAMGVSVTSLKELPPKRVLVAYVRQARRLNEEGRKEPKLARPKGTIRVKVPPDLKAALTHHAQAKRHLDAFPPSARRDYVEWLTEAKSPRTRAKRLATALEWLDEGKRHNWKYERRR